MRLDVLLNLLLVKAIDESCSVWEKVNWSKDYDESLFFNYVLPYRVYDEMLSAGLRKRGRRSRSPTSTS